MAGETRSWTRVLGIGFCVVILAVGGALAGKYLLDQRSEDGINSRLAAGSTDQMRDALLSLDREKLDSDEGKKAIEITAERMKDMSFSDIMEIMRSKELTEEERRRLRDVGREVMMTTMNTNVDEYFDATKEEREAVLDRHIDDWTKFREQMEAYREEHKDDPDHEAERERQRWRTRDRQDAKSRMEGGDPDRQKRMFAYWGKMKARMEARGMNMRGGPGGRGHRSSGGEKSGRSQGGGRGK